MFLVRFEMSCCKSGFESEYHMKRSFQKEAMRQSSITLSNQHHLHRTLMIPLALSDEQNPLSPSEMTVTNTELLDFLDQGLRHVEDTLQGLEANQDLLGPAILRKCSDIADGIHQLANELENYTEEQLHQLAQACQQDCPSLRDTSFDARNHDILSTQDWIQAIQGATILLKDVEAVFREVCSQDAEELAEVTLVVARIFLVSLQSIHASIEAEENERSSVIIQELSDFSSNPPKSPLEAQKKQQERMRLIWPRLGPAVASATQWGSEAAKKSPLLAAALGLTLWPVAIGTVMIGGSLVVADGVLQDTYNHYQEAPLIRSLEEGFAHIYFSTKLLLVGSKFASRQTLRVLSRQIERNGGVGQLAKTAGEIVLDRVSHPVETIFSAWDGLRWSIGFVSHTIQSMLEQQHEKKLMERL